MQNINEVYHRKLKATRKEFLEACNRYITTNHAYMLRLIKRDIKATETRSYPMLIPKYEKYFPCTIM